MNISSGKNSSTIKSIVKTAFQVFIVLGFSKKVSAQVTLAGWDMNGLSAYGISPYSPTTSATNITITGLTRGSGITTTPTAATNGWGGNGMDGTTSAATAITANDFITFGVTANASYSVSFTSISAYNIRRSASGATNGQWQYQVGSGGTWIDIGTPITWGSTTTATGNSQAAISLSGITSLQNVNSGTLITFRLALWGASAAGGTWYINQFQTGDDFILTGTVASSGTPTLTTPTATSITTIDAILGANVTSDGGATITDKGTVWGTAANPIGNYLQHSTSGTGVYSHSRTGLTANTVYVYRGRATNANGTSYSPDGTFTTLHNAPTVGTGSSATNNSFTANWTAPTGGGSAAYTYEIQVDDDNLFGSVNFTQNLIASGTFSTSATGLSAATTYYYRVRAVNAGGNSAWSSVSAGITTLANPPVVVSPTATGIGTTGATLNATITSSGSTAITIRGFQYATTPAAVAAAVVDNAGGTAVSAYSLAYTSTFTPNTLYYFRGYAMNATVVGTTSNSSFTTLHNAPGMASASSIGVTSFTANWTAPTGGGSEVFTYEIQVDDDIAFGSINFTQNSISSGTVSTNVTGLSASTNYYYRVRAVNAGGNSAWSAISSALLTSSNESIVVDNTTYATVTPEFNSSTSYINFTNATSTTTGKIIAMKFKLQDGGADLTDADLLSTVMTDMKFTVVDAAATGTSRLAFIKTAILTTTGGTVISTATKVGNELVFSGMSGANVTATDGTEQSFHLRISFDETQVIDKVKLLYTISSVTASANGSAFASANGGGAQTDATTSNNRNRIEVIADRLRFSTQPVDGTTNVNISTFVVQAQDANAKVDVDAINTFTLTTSGTGMTSSSPYTLSAGSLSISNVQFSAVQSNITLTATTSGLSNDNDDISTTFSISSVTSGSYRTVSAGNWLGSTGLATWERFVSGSWSSSAAPAASTSNIVYIRHTVSSNGSFANSINLVIESGGNFTVTASSTAASVWVKTGGYFKMGSTCTIATGGNFEVESGATFEYNGSTSTPSTTIWNGTEVFRAGSLVLITNWNQSQLLFTSTAISTTTVGSYSAMFGNLKLQFASGVLGSNWGPVVPSSTGMNFTHGYFEIENNDVSNINLCGGTTDFTVGGNFVVSGSTLVQCKTTAGNVTVNVKGNYSQTGGTLRLNSFGTTSLGNDLILNVDGNFSVSGTSTFVMDNSSSSGPTVAINLKGSLTKPNTAFMTQTNAATNASFNFIGSGANQNINVNATSSDMLRYRFFVKSGASVKVINQNWQFNDQSVLTVESGGTLDFGFNGTTALNLTEVGTSPVTSFVLNSGGIIKITSPQGITTSASNTGNVRLDTRTYNAAATYHYIGITPAQVTGDGLPTASSTKKVIVELDALSTTLTPSASFILATGGGQLDIRQGTLIETPAINVSGAGTLVMSGGLYKTSVTASNVPLLTGAYSLSGSSTIELNAAGAQTLQGGNAYRNLTFSTSGTKTISSAITSLTGTVTISGSTILDVSNKSLGGSGTNITMSGTSRYITAGTGTKPDATGTYTLGSGTTVEFSNLAATMESIRLSPSYFNIDVSGSSVGNASLTTPITMQAGGTFTVKTNGTFKCASTAGFAGTTSTSISSANNPTIILETNSTVEYNGTTQALTNTTNYANLLLSGTGTKTAPTGTLTVNGNFTNNSTFAPQTGTVLLSGITQQTISSNAATTFYNITLTNAAGAVLGFDQNLTGTLTLNNGTFNTNSKVFTLQATQSGSVFTTGKIGQIQPTANITGNVTVEQYAVRSGATNWGLLGTPILDASGLTMADWNDDFSITCSSCPDGSAPGGTAFTSIYSYDESGTGLYDDASKYIPITSISDPIALTKGYWVYLGNAAGTAIKFSVTGSVAKAQVSPVTIPLTYNNHGSSSDDGWNLISNPLPCPISWTSLLASTTNIDNGIYVYNSNTGSYSQYVGGVSSPAIGSGGIGDNIPMCQGFYVHSTGATSLSALESNKVGTADPNFLRVNPAFQQVQNYIPVARLFLSDNTGLRDEVAFHFNASATTSFDPKYDAYKLINDFTLPYLGALSSDGEFCSINGLPNLNTSMPLKVISPVTQTFTFNLGGDTINGVCVNLYDSYTGITTNLTANAYSCTLYDTTTVARFTISFASSSLTATTNIDQPICANPHGTITAIGNNSGPWNYTWKDNNGTIVKSTTNSLTADSLLQINGGVYTLEMSTSGQCDNYSETFVVDTIISPNAQFISSSDTVNLAFNSNVYFEPVQIGNYNYSWNFGDGVGSSYQTNPTYNYNGSGNFIVTLMVSSESNCISQFSKNIVVINSAMVGLSHQGELNQINIANIDASNYMFMCNAKEDGDISYFIYDLSGKLLLKETMTLQQLNKRQINLSNYASGIYLLYIEDERNNQWMYKLTK